MKTQRALIIELWYWFCQWPIAWLKCHGIRKTHLIANRMLEMCYLIKYQPWSLHHDQRFVNLRLWFTSIKNSHLRVSQENYCQDETVNFQWTRESVAEYIVVLIEKLQFTIALYIYECPHLIRYIQNGSRISTSRKTS